MSREFPTDPESELTAIEAALGALTPSRSAVNRDAIMFRAGQESARSRWVWPSATAALAFIALGEGAILTLRPTPEARIIERIVEVPAAENRTPVVILRQNPPANSEPSEASPLIPETGSLARQDYYHLRDQALRFGVEGLPEPAPLAVRADPDRERESFRSEIRSLLDPGGTL